ncbi:pre-mRNA-processing protein 45 [Lanmaoa asiatica]|nr:pre-mRNA-processing protein 45 [Lanmaoa asiatica]
MAALAVVLPHPIHVSATPDDEDHVSLPIPSQAVTVRAAIPPYGKRKGWKPTSPEDFGDGGAYPECHVAQYPLNPRKEKGNTLALQVDSEGNVRYDAIAHQGQRAGKVIQSQFKDLVPLSHRKDITDDQRSMERPSEEEVQATAERTRQALEKLVTGKIKAAQPKNVPGAVGKTTYVRYTPGQQQGGDGALKQRIIKMSEVLRIRWSPLASKHKKIPRGPPSPPPPVLRSPPRKATAAEQKEWMIPPCISNWKNNKGFNHSTRQTFWLLMGEVSKMLVSPAGFSVHSPCSLFPPRHAREEVRQRALMQQKLAQKEKEAKEENLRLLAQRAREERSGTVPSASSRPTTESRAVVTLCTRGYGSESEAESSAANSEDEDEEAAKIRDVMRAEKRRERERDMRMSNMGTEQRAKMLARQQNRDISEKIALGLAKPTLSKENMLDSRLFNREQLSSTFGDDESYGLYDRPLFHGSTAAAAIYKARGNIAAEGSNEEAFGGGTEEGIGKALSNDRFGLGQPRVGFEGASEQEVREGPVQFEKDSGDVFGLDKFLDEAKGGRKRGLDTEVGGSRKRVQLEKAGDM